MPANDAQLEQDLVAAGERWRDGQPPAPPVGVVWHPPARPWRVGGGFGLVAAVIVVATSAAVLGGGGGPTPGRSPHPSPAIAASNVALAWDAEQLQAAEIRPGDAVTGVGVVMVEGGEPPKLCAGAFDELMFGVPPSCGAPSVQLTGSLDIEGLPGRQVVAGTTFSAWVRVEGRWTGTSIEDPTVAAAPSPGFEPPLPCPTPEGGWSNPATGGAFRAALDPLAREVADHPELYAGYYTQPTYGSKDSLPDIEVVRTKVDPRTLAPRVGRLFPYALCLTQDYTQADIDAVAFAFEPGPISVPNVAGDTHRVEVAVTAVDERTLPLFLAHPAAYPKALVTKATLPVETGPTPGPTSTVAPFELPSEVDGVAVVTAADAPAALAATQPGQTILVGGWLKPFALMSCPAMQTFPDAWNPCFAIRLYGSPWGSSAVGVYQPGLSVDLPTVPAGQVQPIVLRVHSHDPGCPAVDDCASLPALDGVAWLGRAGPPAAPTTTAPPNGLSEATADSLAVAAAKARWQSVFPVRAISARAGHYAEVGPPGSTVVDGDRWVWAVVVTEGIGYVDCAKPPCQNIGGATSLVILDYVTGEVLIQEQPAPSN